MISLVWAESPAPVQCPENKAPDDCRDIDFRTPAEKTTTRTGCFWSKATQSKVMYSVTFPKGYRMDANCKKPYPYMIFLHGRGGDHQYFENIGGEQELNRVLSEPGGKPFLVVAPAEPVHSYWKDGAKKGSRHFGTATMVSEDLVRHIESKSCVAKERCLSGVSMGGHGSIYLKMRNPEVFKHAYAIAPVFRGEQGLHECDREAYGKGHDYNRQDPVALFLSQAHRKKRGACCQLRAEIAADDSFLTDKKRSDTMASIGQMMEVCPDKVRIEGFGGHGSAFFTPALGRALKFCSDAFSGRRLDEECSSESRSSGHPSKAQKLTQ